MNDYYIKGKIAEIIPVSVYENKVYTQDIILELEDGVKIEIDDSMKKCNNDDVGKIKCMQIHAHVVKPIIKNENKYLKVIRLLKHGPHTDVYGFIEKLIPDKPENKVILNFRFGKILLFADDKQINNFSENEYITVKGARLYLNKLKDI